ncbi:hypothetical protein [Actinomadura sp. 3N508]|uniref:hypothetical protein n=1 Tax=Actinomadura sp. 3N508 TaxID=3375153 RepID=UPI00378AA94D
MATETASAGRFGAGLRPLNQRYHRAALGFFLVIVIAHWAEHIAQAIQIYALGWLLKESRGVLGMPFPWLVTSEWMHYGYALLMLAGLIMLRPGFVGRSRAWWNAALLIQVWHHFEHLLLLLQALTGNNIASRPVPTSIIQLLIPQVELHLFYNAIVFMRMVVAMLLHRRPRASEHGRLLCTCAVVSGR